MGKWIVVLSLVLGLGFGCSEEEETEATEETTEEAAPTTGPSASEMKSVGCNSGGDFHVVCKDWQKMLKEGWKPVGYTTSTPGPGSHHHYVLFQR